MHSLMVIRHGHVVAEGWWKPYRVDLRHSLFSLSKSFTSTAVGLAIAEGKLRIDDPVFKFFPEDAPEKPDANLKAMRVSDLLRMSTGQQSEPPRPADQPWTRAFLHHPVPFRPGTHFLYNTSATYMLSAIVQKATGQNLLDFLTPRLFEPLGIENPTWQTSPQGISTGGYGLSIRTEDIAKFGLLYLRNGNWNGKQLIPREWVERATTLQTSNGSDPQSDWNQGYGYQFWRSRHNAYRGDGAFGQYCIVLPEQDTVIAITSAVNNMQQVLDLVWTRLLPAIQPDSLPPSIDAERRLKERLARLSLHSVEGKTKPEFTPGKSFEFPRNDLRLESIRVEPSEGDTIRLVTRFDGKEHTITARPGTWTDAHVTWGLDSDDQPASTSIGWTSPTELTLRVCFIETPFELTTTFAFDNLEVKVDTVSNVAFGPRRRPTLTGKATPSR
ncbi:MAG: serine hydrolase domain-containing protein [Isosphaeraceae bacterium]